MAQVKQHYTRKELIELAEMATKVHVKDWDDRDTPDAMAKAAKAWMLLRSECDFFVQTKEAILDHKENNPLITDENTVWLYIWSPTFNYFEGITDRNEKELFYLPTKRRLKKVKGKDWY